MLTVKRTLVKSGPELWAEVTDAAAIARHLSPFESVRITRAEPERLVEWEGELAHGELRLEPSGFGTRVTITADTRRRVGEPDPAPAPQPVEEPRPVEEPQAAAARRGMWGRLFRRRPAGGPAPVEVPQATEPTPEPPAPEPEPLMPDDRARAVLEETLEALGKAHHRPFSRV